MTIGDLILIESRKVRSNPDLMAFYIESFKTVLGYAPQCVGCSFSTDWLKFKRAVSKDENIQLKNKTIMGSFKLKKTQNKIFSYKANGKTYRLYDNHFNIDFVRGFLTNGTAAEIKARKEMFSVLPDEFQDKPKQKPEPVKVDPIADEIEVVDPVVETVKEQPQRQPKKKHSPRKK